MRIELSHEEIENILLSYIEKEMSTAVDVDSVVIQQSDIDGRYSPVEGLEFSVEIQK